MVFGEFILFLCLFVPFIYFVEQRGKFASVRLGYRLLTIGLGLVSLTSFIDFLVIGPNHLLPFVILGDRAMEFWRIYGYLPGLISIVIGMTVFLPAVGNLKKEIQAREETEQKLLAQTSDLQQAKFQAEKAEGVLVEALESISDAFIIFDVDDRVVAFNSRYKELFSTVADILKPGVTFEELIRQQADAHYMFRNVSKSEEWIQQRLDEHRNPHEPKEQVFEDGRIYRLSEFKTASGGIVAIRTDITELRERENALRHLNDRFQEAQSVAHIGNWIHDFQGKLYEWSPEMSRIMGYVPGQVEICSKTYLDRVHPDDLERMNSVVKWAAEKGEEYQIEYRFIRPDEQVVHVREIGQIQLDAEDQPYLISGTVQDITSQHLAEKALIEAKLRAEEGTKVKSMFLANMSHELRTPLNAVIGFADVISKEIFGPVENPKYKEYSENILSSGQHLLALINDILDFSRIEAGESELIEEQVDLHEVITWTEFLLSPKATEKDITLNFSGDDRYTFTGDERKMKQVMINLINNAIKFSPEGGKIQVLVDGAAENYFSISVEDNGPGIGAAEMDHVMRPFGRTQYSVARSIEGTGLGLPLAKSIVELHDGELRIESKEDQGTVVEIRLPKKRFSPQK